MIPTFGDNNGEKKHQTLNKDQKPSSSFLPFITLIPFFSHLFPFTVFLSSSNIQHFTLFLLLFFHSFFSIFLTKPFRAQQHFHCCQQVRTGTLQEKKKFGSFFSLSFSHVAVANVDFFVCFSFCSPLISNGCLFI